MIWFFRRDSAQVDVEVRRLPEAGSYALIINYPDGSEKVERFESPRRLIARALAVQHRLIKSGWVPGSPGGVREFVRPPSIRPHPLYVRTALGLVARLHQTITRVAAVFGF